MQAKKFHDIEHDGWSQRASIYDELFASVSTQAIDPILTSLQDLQRKRLLDTACGTGHLVAAASKRGAISEGVDFAVPMIDAARANYPAECFRLADVTRLPYEDDSFDAVTCSFGLSHIEYPLAAVCEAFRVLKVGGRFAFTLWFGAEDGGELHAIGQDAIAKYAVMPFNLPNSWTQLRFANERACENVVKQAGFKSPQFKRLPIILQSTNVQQVLDVIEKLSIRTRMILDSQTLKRQQNIREYILSAVEAHRVDGIISLQWPALLTVVEKPK